VNPIDANSSRQILAQLNALLTQAAEPTHDQMKAAHEAAERAIRNINARLSSAHQLIVAGRRAEAIELAQTPPDVVEEVAVWDSSLIRDWNYWSSHFRLPTLTPLRSDLATTLSSAYTIERQLEHLLKRHRLLAIGRGNLQQRIAVLSQLAAADPSNPQWNRALAQYQRKRLEQLAERAAQGQKLGDLGCLQQVVDEVRETRWLTPSAKTQLDTLQRQIARFRDQHATLEAIALSEHIHDAFAARDSVRLAPLLAYWAKIEPLVDAAAVADELPHVQAAIEWLEQNTEVHSTVVTSDGTADHAVAVPVSGTPVETAAASVDASQEQPAQLRKAYARRAAQEQRSRSWKGGLITAVIVTVVLGVAIWLRSNYLAYRRDATLTKMLGTIDQKLTVGELAAADQLLSEAPADDERFADVRSRLQEQQQAADRRAAQFQADVAATETAIDEATRLDTFDSLSRGISELARRANSDAEEEAAGKLSRQLRAARDARKQVVMEEARQLIVKIRDGLESLEPDANARSVLAQWNLQLLRTRTDRWIGEESALLAELEATSEAVADRREAIRAMAKDRNE